MFGVVKIGEKEVEMLANGATPYRYKTVFHEDYLAKVTGKISDAEATDMMAKMGYIMAMQAEKADMTKLSLETFIEWLEQFNPNDIYAATSAISDIYAGNAESDVAPK